MLLNLWFPPLNTIVLNELLYLLFVVIELINSSPRFSNKRPIPVDLNWSL